MCSDEQARVASVEKDLNRFGFHLQGEGYTIISTLGPKITFPGTQGMTLADVERWAACYAESAERDLENDHGAAADLQLLKDQWNALSDDKRAIIAEVWPYAAAFFGVIYTQ
jgi:hypothetical protein